jgi:hypothetical protein
MKEIDCNQAQRVEQTRHIARRMLASPRQLSAGVAAAEGIDWTGAAARFFSCPAELPAKAQRVRRLSSTEPQRLAGYYGYRDADVSWLVRNARLRDCARLRRARPRPTSRNRMETRGKIGY